MKWTVMALLLAGWTAAQAPSSAGYPAYEKANRLFVAGKYQESFNAVDEALRLDPKLVPALTLKAKLAMAANRYDVARESLEQALAAGNVDVERGSSRVQGGCDPAHRDCLEAV